MDQEGEYKERRTLKGKDLYKAAEAVSRLESLLGGTPVAKRHLTDKVKDGSLSVFARRRWETDQLITKKFKIARPPDVVEKRRVKNLLFANTSDLLDLSERWNWKLGNFWLPRFKKSGEFRKQYVLEGVRFKKADIELIASNFEYALKIKGNRGRPVDEEKWARFTYELMRFGNSPEYPGDPNGLQKTFIMRFRKAYEKHVKAEDRLSYDAYSSRLAKAYNYVNDEARTGEKEI